MRSVLAFGAGKDWLVRPGRLIFFDPQELGLAREELRAGSFGLVISDWNMQPMTGLQLLQEVRVDSKLKSMPFIMITAESKAENVIAAKQAGVSNYIVKPFNAETLREKIEKVLGHA